MAADSIFAGMYNEPYDIKDNHSRMGVAISLIIGLRIIFLNGNPFTIIQRCLKSTLYALGVLVAIFDIALFVSIFV